MSESGERMLHELLDAWASRITARQPAQVAELFTEGALFQGFDPEPGFGRAVVEAYYAKQPVGLTPEYELLSAHEASDDVLVGYARVVFHRPDVDAHVYLTVVAERHGGEWLLSHYHVSKIAS